MLQKETNTCDKCKYFEVSKYNPRTKFWCQRIKKWFKRQDRYFTCLFFEQKEVNPENAKRTDKTRKPEELEIRRKSTTKE